MRLPSFTLRTKLIATGAATALGFTCLVATGWIAGAHTYSSVQEARLLTGEVETVQSMHKAELRLVLAAMDSIIDRGEGRIDPERLDIIAQSLEAMKAGAETARAVAGEIGEPALMDNFDANLAQVAEAIQVKLPALIESGADESQFAAIDDAIDDGGELIQQTLSTLASKGTARVNQVLEETAATAQNAKLFQTAAALFFLLLIALAFATVGRDLFNSLKRLREDMVAIADGNFDHEILGTERNDEAGVMARTLLAFRNDAQEKLRMEGESEAAQRAADADRAARDRTKRAEEAVLANAVSELAGALERLAGGDLTVRLDTAFEGDLERVRVDFNSSVERLSATMSDIARTSREVLTSASEIGTATDDLSRRTEQQAASLEETAAALDEVTATVRSASQRAEEASEMVGTAKTGAEKSGQVVRNAVDAMKKIEDSSSQISQIISVIDDIAFQTNLLALNAGVEAARAGEAGKGFAVVAQEVRELAQRSANAAKEIKTLIETSSSHVHTGVTLVNETGTSLGTIEEQVARINEHIQSIVTASREQSTAIAEINSAINQMDHVTQQNAAMVEQTNAATQGLAGEAATLERLVGGFRTGSDAGTAARAAVKHEVPAGNSRPSPVQPARAAAARPDAVKATAAKPKAASQPKAATDSAKPAASPARALNQQLANAFPGSKSAAAEDSWEEF